MGGGGDCDDDDDSESKINFYAKSTNQKEQFTIFFVNKMPIVFIKKCLRKAFLPVCTKM